MMVATCTLTFPLHRHGQDQFLRGAARFCESDTCEHRPRTCRRLALGQPVRSVVVDGHVPHQNLRTQSEDLPPLMPDITQAQSVQSVVVDDHIPLAKHWVLKLLESSTVTVMFKLRSGCDSNLVTLNCFINSFVK